jgi:hypothetical protein
MNQLTPENYAKGFLVDQDLMAGVSRHPDSAGSFLAFVLQHTTGEYLGHQAFDDLSLAIDSINKIPRKWVFERAGGCGDGNCGEAGNCSKGSCALKKCDDGSCGPVAPNVAP